MYVYYCCLHLLASCFQQELDLCLKWPNDIYFGDKMKLGGVLVTSTIMDKMVHATVGEQCILLIVVKT